MVYISNFLLNLVSLGCMQKRGFDWSHLSGKISKNNQIIGYTRFHGNNYEIGDDDNVGIVFVIFAVDPTTLGNSRHYQKPHSAVTSDTLHRRMGHIGPLRLHILGKECLGVRLREKQCPSVSTPPCLRYLSKCHVGLYLTNQCNPSTESTLIGSI